MGKGVGVSRKGVEGHRGVRAGLVLQVINQGVEKLIGSLDSMREPKARNSINLVLTVEQSRDFAKVCDKGD